MNIDLNDCGMAIILVVKEIEMPAPIDIQQPISHTHEKEMASLVAEKKAYEISRNRYEAL